MLFSNSVLYVCFSQAGNSFPVILCFMIRTITHVDGQVEWLMDEQVMQSPVQIAFEHFPQAAV